MNTRRKRTPRFPGLSPSFVDSIKTANVNEGEYARMALGWILIRGYSRSLLGIRV